MSRLLYLLPAVAALLAAQQAGSFIELPPAILDARLTLLPLANADRAATLRRLFTEARCPDLADQPVPKSDLPNIVCTVPGQNPERILVTAHFDKVADGEGALDNWTGASLLPSLLESLRAHPRRYTLVFIGFTDEEKGLIGSRAYVAGLTKPEQAQIRAVVNLDSLALGPLRIWSRRADPELNRAAAAVSRGLAIPLTGVNVDQFGDSDTHAFADRNIPVIDFHSVTKADMEILHTRRDRLSAVNRRQFYDAYRFLAAYLAAIDFALAPR